MKTITLQDTKFILEWEWISNLDSFLSEAEDAIEITVNGVAKKISKACLYDEYLLVPKSVCSLAIYTESGHLEQNAPYPIVYNESTAKLECEYALADTMQAQYLRFILSSGLFTLYPEYREQDYKLILSGCSHIEAELVPVSYFADFYLSTDTKNDIAYKEAVEGYIKNNRDAVKNTLQSATAKLETKTKLYFLERTVKESKDYNFDRYTVHLWQFQTQYAPITRLEQFEIKFANNKVASVHPSLFVVEKLMGMIEFVPLPNGDSAGLYSLLMNDVSGMAVSVLSSQVLDRIPSMFNVTYRTGVIHAGSDHNEKEMIRQAVCKRALMDLLPIIDPSVRQPSKTEAIDGVSSSRSYGNDNLFKLFKEQEDEFCLQLMKKYARNIDMVVV